MLILSIVDCSFCRAVLDTDAEDEHYQFLAQDWPRFIYKETLYDPSSQLQGLLQSSTCIKARTWLHDCVCDMYSFS